MYGSGCIDTKIETEVVVVGAGLAGIVSAITAAESGARVCVLSRGRICSGSSFYPGTWGLGLVGPENEADGADLEKTILEVGEQMADPELTHTLVSGITDGIRYFQNMGIRLREAAQNGDREFIPCFDHKNRDWHGLEKESAGEIFLGKLEDLGVCMLEKTSVIRLLKRGERVCGVLAVRNNADGAQLVQIHGKAVILATGGIGGLFRYRLNTGDVRGTGQWLALRAGAGLVNLEFMQMMPGYVKPAPKTIYNEKVFRYSDFEAGEQKLFEDWPAQELRKCMEVRSTHGPFTSRLASGKIDLELFRAFTEYPEGVKVTYQDRIKENQPEFIRIYFDWLRREKHLSVDDPVWIGMFAHASNGGIRIDSEASTGVPGLYACGECTGMMHGADRLGGLSTANGLVFGRIAGRSAARQDGTVSCSTGIEGLCEPLYVVENTKEYLEELRLLNFRTAMVLRSGEKSSMTLAAVKKLGERLKAKQTIYREGAGMEGDLLTTADLEAAVMLSQALHQAILLRKESRGPHFREDFPEKCKEYETPIVSKMDKGVLRTEALLI